MEKIHFVRFSVARTCKSWREMERYTADELYEGKSCYYYLNIPLHSKFPSRV